MSLWQPGDPVDVVSVKQRRRTEVRLGTEVSRNGRTSVVFRVDGPDGYDRFLAKMYLPNQKPEGLRQRVRLMEERGLGQLAFSEGSTDHYPLAVPRATIERDGDIVGVLIPRLDVDEFVPIKAIWTHPVSRDVNVAVYVARRLWAITAHAHDKGFVIGDVSDANVWVRPDPPYDVALIDIDSFGVLDDDGHVLWAPTHQTDGYRAPETNAGKHSRRSDVFAIATMALELLLGARHPFQGALHGADDSTRQSNIDGGHSWLWSPELFVLPVSFRDRAGLRSLPSPARQLYRKALSTVAKNRPSASKLAVATADLRFEAFACGHAGLHAGECRECIFVPAPTSASPLTVAPASPSRPREVPASVDAPGAISRWGAGLLRSARSWLGRIGAVSVLGLSGSTLAVLAAWWAR